MKRPFKSDRHVALSNTFPPEGADLLLSSGAVSGPHRVTRPITLTLRRRIARWWKSFNLRRTTL